MFFNADGGTFTFVGFKLSETGDLLHPTTSVVVRRGIASAELMNDLMENKVDLNEDWNNWLVNLCVYVLKTYIALLHLSRKLVCTIIKLCVLVRALTTVQ